MLLKTTGHMVVAALGHQHEYEGFLGSLEAVTLTNPLDGTVWQTQETARDSQAVLRVRPCLS